MRSPFRGFACATVTVILAGCSGLTQIQDSVSKFDQGAHSVATAEMNFLRAVQSADCNAQFYDGGYKFAIGQTDYLDLSGACTPTILTDKQLQIRQALMGAVTLYADKIQTLATGDDNQALDANSQKLAGEINSFATQHGFSSLSVGTAVEAAIIELTNMALDKRRFDDIQSAAKAMADPLSKVVDALKTENTVFAAGISSKMGKLEPQLQLAVKTARNQRGASSFLDVIEARRIMQSVNPFGVAPLAASAGASNPVLDPLNVAAQVNAALDAVVNTNQAIASAGTGGIIAAVNDLVARAQHAQSIQAALNK